ncbi:hypothetical protein [Arthrobacter sp. UYEF36]
MAMIRAGIRPQFSYNRLPGAFHTVLAGNCEKSQDALGMNGQLKLFMREE